MSKRVAASVSTGAVVAGADIFIHGDEAKDAIKDGLLASAISMAGEMVDAPLTALLSKLPLPSALISLGTSVVEAGGYVLFNSYHLMSPTDNRMQQFWTYFGAKSLSNYFTANGAAERALMDAVVGSGDSNAGSADLV